MKKSHDRQSMVYCISEQHIHFGSTGPEVLQSNFIEIGIRHERSPLNLLHIFRTSFYKNTEVDGCFGSFHMKNILNRLPKIEMKSYIFFQVVNISRCYNSRVKVKNSFP